MEFPDDILQLIREYSKPVTNANWRNRQWICVGDLYNDILQKKVNSTRYPKKHLLYQRFMYNVQNNRCWIDLYLYTIENGIHALSDFYNIKLKVCYKIMY